MIELVTAAFPECRTNNCVDMDYRIEFHVWDNPDEGKSVITPNDIGRALM
jgi:hypothetical protein